MPPKDPEGKQPKKKATTAKKASTGSTPAKKTTPKAGPSSSPQTASPQKKVEAKAPQHTEPSYPGPSMDLSEDLRERIAKRAYEIHQKRGGQHGSDWEDWLQAEREILIHEPPPSNRS